MTDVPRVARSLDDLRVGQVVAWYSSRVGKWEIVDDPANNPSPYFLNMLDDGNVVILSDPPPEPVTVSRETFDRLALVVDTHDDQRDTGFMTYVFDAARALVEEGRQS